MRTKKVYSFIYAISGGVIVCIIGFLRALLPYTEMNSQLYTFLLLIANLIGSIVAIFAIIFRNSSLAEMVIRFLLLLFSLGICYVLGVYLKIWTLLLNLLAVHTISGSDNLSGLLFITYIVVVATVSMITIMLKGISVVAKKLMNHR